jgi:hypothetical protein
MYPKAAFGGSRTGRRGFLISETGQIFPFFFRLFCPWKNFAQATTALNRFSKC